MKDKCNECYIIFLNNLHNIKEGLVLNNEK